MSGSLLLIYMILSRRKSKLTRPKNRFMLMMSIFDVLHATTFIVGTMAIPRELGIYGAIGNSYTCTAQGFFAWLGYVVPLYNNSLNLFYLLTIKYNMDSTVFAQKYEPFCHVLSTLVPITSGVVFVYLDWVQVESSNGTMCYVSNKAIILLGFSLLVNLIFLVYTMTMISKAVSSQSNSMAAYRFGSSITNRSRANNEMGGKVQAQRQNGSNRSINCTMKESVMQAKLYTLAFLITFIFPAVEISLTLVGIPNSPLALRILTSAFYPLQGFWNCLFYIRPGVNVVRRRDPEKSLTRAILEVVSNSGITQENPARRRKVRLTSSILTKKIHMKLHEWAHETDDYSSDYVDAPHRVKKTNCCADDDEVDRIESLVEDGMSKITTDIVEKSIDITVDVGGNADRMTELTATHEESLFSRKFLAASQLVESEGFTSGANFDLDVQNRKCRSDLHLSTNDEMNVSEKYSLKSESENDNGSLHRPGLQRKCMKARQRMSLLSLASVLSDMSFDSL